jgi:maltose O-acetyltransferase
MYDDKEKKQGDDPGVTIRDDVWVGANAIILAGVELGEGCVIGAGAVVTKSIPPYAIAVGIPARTIKMRFSANEIARHRGLLGLDQ